MQRRLRGSANVPGSQGTEEGRGRTQARLPPQSLLSPCPLYRLLPGNRPHQSVWDPVESEKQPCLWGSGNEGETDSGLC